MNWKNNFKQGKEIILATSSKNSIPNANIVISLGFVNGKLLIADCQMSKTIKNLKKNQNICAVGGYFRIKGNVKIFASGKYFDVCVQKSKGYCVKNAILIKIDGIFDLDKGKIVR
jgi:thiamine biosynthesis protein ThiC